MRVESEKNAQAKRLCFLEDKGFEVMKNKKIYGDPKKLSSFKNEGKLASRQPNFKGTTSLFRKEVIKPQL